MPGKTPLEFVITILIISLLTAWPFAQLRETEAMDSRPLTCLPRGSVVTVLKSTVSDDYGILSRRVLVRHVSEAKGDATEGWASVSEEKEEATEGWASVQSSQGYVILSPLVSLCYENTRWGNTRPIIRQCGHAAHLRCVETHTLSLHQRAAGEQPYDGRFAANIDDGEFLCPLCKQLSNILIPRDGCARGKEKAEPPMTIEPTHTQQTKDPEKRLRQLLLDGFVLTKERLEMLSDIGQKALSDFGAHLLQAMDVPWERTTGARKRKHRRWHPAIQRWDYEEEDDDLTASNSGSSVKSVLRLLRQQHIAWAAVGHSAAAAEACSRGLEEILPFGSFSKTDDPWSGYKDSKDSHPMLLELKRTLTGASGLLEVLMFEMAKQLRSEEAVFKDKEVSIVGKCLAEILGGRSWFLAVEAARRSELPCQLRDNLILWSQLSALMASMPCHVARDGMISQRHEARAAAAAMWTVRGLGTQVKPGDEPPLPLAVEKVFATTSPRPPEISYHWGTMSPSVGTAPLEIKLNDPTQPPFRPAVASAFLYTPLLTWDLNTLAGAVFSATLLNEDRHLPCSEDLLQAARLLIVGRIIQAIITPHGFDSPNNVDLAEEDEEDRWGPDGMQNEGEHLCKLVAHCRAMIEAKSLDASTRLLPGKISGNPANLFGSLGRAILPFARSVILMLRAASAAIKSRQRRHKADTAVLTEEDRMLEIVIEGSETMTTNDGFYVLKAMNGPMPSSLIEEAGSWWPLINRWLVSIIGLELHHGSRGSSLISEINSVQRNTSSEHEKIAASESTSQGIRGPSIESNESRPDTAHSASVTRTSQPRIRLQVGGDSDAEDENMDVDQPDTNDRARLIRIFGDNHVVDEDLDESDEDLIEEMEMDEAENLVGYADQVLGNAGFDAGRHTGGGNEEDSADEPSSSGSDGEGDGNEASYVFASVSQSPIISYQPSLLAVEKIGPGRQGSVFESSSASAVMADLSHLGLIHRKGTPPNTLHLPNSSGQLTVNADNCCYPRRSADFQLDTFAEIFCGIIWHRQQG